MDFESKHLGELKLSEELVLNWLGLEGGSIKGARWDYLYNSLFLGIEHPKMPVVREGEVLRMLDMEEISGL